VSEEDRKAVLKVLLRADIREWILSRSELVARSGYENISKGLRRLDQVYAGDLDKAGTLLGALPSALNLPPDTVQTAIRAQSGHWLSGRGRPIFGSLQTSSPLDRYRW
jgi:hypothetical protein